MHRAVSWEESSKRNNWWKNHLVYYIYTWAALLNTDYSHFKFLGVPLEDEKKVNSEPPWLSTSCRTCVKVLECFPLKIPRFYTRHKTQAASFQLFQWIYWCLSSDEGKATFFFPFFFPGLKSLSLLPCKLSELLALSHPTPLCSFWSFPLPMTFL